MLFGRARTHARDGDETPAVRASVPSTGAHQRTSDARRRTFLLLPHGQPYEAPVSTRFLKRHDGKCVVNLQLEVLELWTRLKTEDI